jgi:hypothetical protein
MFSVRIALHISDVGPVKHLLYNGVLQQAGDIRK